MSAPRRRRNPRSWWKRRQGNRPLVERHPAAIAVAGLTAMALIGFGVYHADALPITGGGTAYTADFGESSGLNPGDDVRIAGVKVGKVDTVALDGPKVKVAFTVKGAWVGEDSTVAIGIKTLLGSKYLAVDPRGARAQDPARRIPITRTTSPYDVLDALDGLGSTVGEIDSARLAESFTAVSGAFRDTPPHVGRAVKGLAELSMTIGSRDAQIGELLRNGNAVTRTLDGKKDRLASLLGNGRLLLAEVNDRRAAIASLLRGATDLGTELTGLVGENNATLGPALDALDRVTAVLVANKKGLDRILAKAGPYYRLLGNALGNGRWMDSYLCGLVPKSYLPEGTPPRRGCMPPPSTS
ncbi:MCE family protein [Streptomyces lichenis]|uniref:MCE family protein n=1 Tax=Streptomyces lichenis TaxID=2306967 RepID=A0ABT0IH36_9ACTN|nr:MCE family protein [Streptomyces lichenis]MCK8680639.1 MCE family protein [Streptomyces lichenis]